MPPTPDVRERFEQSLTIAAPPAVVFGCFFSPDALRAWWQVVRSVTTPGPFGVFAVEWLPTPYRDDLLGPLGGVGALATTPSWNKGGWFVGGGVENNLNIFGISAPGWFMKTEYRAAYFGTKNLQESDGVTGLPTNVTTTFKPFVETISTSLVYRFNWTGPVVAKY